MLPSESAAESGRWRTSRTEYMREIMDSCNNHNTRQVTIMSAAQLGKTELLLNIIGYFVHYQPSPMLLIQPTADMAKTFSRDRLAPTIRDTKALTDLFAASKGRDSANTMLQKSFIGGNLALVGSNSPSQLASRPIRVVLFDEVDRYEITKEGDAVDLATRRTATFIDHLIVKVSTPNEDGTSRIQQSYENGSKAKFYIKCIHCEAEFSPIWEDFDWDKDEKGKHLPQTAGIKCPSCEKRNEQRTKLAQFNHGRWIHDEPDNIKHRSFQMASWVSPFVTYEQVVEDFLRSNEAGSDSLKVHINTFWGQPFKRHVRLLDINSLMERRRPFALKDHESYSIVTIGIDMQDDRAEFEVVGWNSKLQSWSLGYHVVYGNPNTHEFWADLDAALAKHNFDALAIDTGGHHTQNTYRWVYNNFGRRYYPVKGVGGDGVPLLCKPTKQQAAKGRMINLYKIGSNACKNAVLDMLKREIPTDNGYCHFTEELDEEYFLQLTSERPERKKSTNNTYKTEWVKLRKRNEAWDCRNYAYVALEILQPNWKIIERKDDESLDFSNSMGDTPQRENYTQLIKKARKKPR